MKSLLFTTALTLLCLCTALARPAYRGVQYATMEDGSRIAYRLVGDEHQHAFMTLDGRYIQRIAEIDSTVATTATAELWRYVPAPTPQETAQASAAIRRARQDISYPDFPTIGDVRGLVLLVEFTDVHFQPAHDQALFDRQLNEEDYSDHNATGSARDYFIAQSMGQFRPQFDVVGPIQLPHNESFYGRNQGYAGNDSNPGQMVIDACTIAHDSLGIDFSQYDYNEDGEVDFVFCLYAGYGENYGASSSTIWPHMSWLNAQWLYYSLDGKEINLYACSCELKYATGKQIDGIGAVCHEFGHVLGLPDLYNTQNSYDTQLGDWDVMDSGSYNNESRTPASYTAFERHLLGWMDFIDLTEPQDSVVVPEMTQNNVAYRIFTANHTDEFFTLENHQKVGWDKAEPGRGLMIIHVDYDRGIWNNNSVNSGLHPHYDLVEADGSQGRATSTDLYPIPSNNMFTDYSRPNSLSWKGVPTNGGVTQITQNDDGTVSFRFKHDRLEAPELLPVTCMTDTSFRAEWMAVEHAIGYQLQVREILPDSLNPLLLCEDFSLVTDGKYPSATSTDIAPNIDDYMHTSGWEGQSIFASGGMIRLGGYGFSGSVTTPLLQSADTLLCLALRCCAYTGKTVNYDIQLLDAEGATVQKFSYKATREVTTPFITFSQCPSDFRISISSKMERLFIDDLRLAVGETDSLAMWSAGPKEWTLSCTADEATLLDDNGEPTGVAGIVISQLAPGRTYIYNVKAIDIEPLCNSDVTADASVTLPTASGISQIVADQPAEGTTAFGLDGRVYTNDISTLPRGLYIIGGRKVLIQ